RRIVDDRGRLRHGSSARPDPPAAGTAAGGATHAGDHREPERGVNGRQTGGTIMLCAGGTAGHLFPAEALATGLVARGWRVHLATDHRVETYARGFPAEAVHTIPSATMTRTP